MESREFPLLVPPEVSRKKLERELIQWDAVRDSYRRRGYWIIDRRNLTVDVAFVAPLPLLRPIPALVAIARVDFSNYDIWPPSIRFVDPTGERDAVPLIPPVETDGAGGIRDLVLDHPTLNRQFVCIAGVREYHDHPQHSGDLWLVRRSSGAGRLAVICERLWRAFTDIPIGTQFNAVITNEGAQLNFLWGRVQTVGPSPSPSPDPVPGPSGSGEDSMATRGSDREPEIASVQSEPST